MLTADASRWRERVSRSRLTGEEIGASRRWIPSSCGVGIRIAVVRITPDSAYGKAASHLWHRESECLPAATAQQMGSYWTAVLYRYRYYVY